MKLSWWILFFFFLQNNNINNENDTSMSSPQDAVLVEIVRRQQAAAPMICLFKNWDSHISMWKSQNKRTVANSLWKASYSSELTTERTAELGGKKKKTKNKKMDKFFNLKDFDVEPKHPSRESLRRWRSACTIVKNRKRRFRVVADLDRRSEAEKKKRQMQVLFSLAAFIPLLFSFSFFSF